MKLVFLWTDFFVIALSLVFVGIIFLIKTDIRVNLAWKKFAENSVNLVALLVLTIYLTIAALDSIHFQHKLEGDYDGNQDFSSKVISVLDLILSPIASEVEKTYSAPFAVFAYSSELVKDSQGRLNWERKRLKYGGSYLEDVALHTQDLKYKTIKIMVITFAIAIILTILFWSLFRKYWLVFLSLYGFIGVCTAFYVLKSNYHIFGTDKVGQDVFYAAVKSIRTGIVIGVLTSIIMLPFAIFFGTVAGYYRGYIDSAIQYIYTTISSVPGVLLIAASILMVQVYIDKNIDSLNLVSQRSDIRLLILCIVLGVTGWIGLCRLLRAETLKLKEENYILAARALGVSNFNIIRRHIIPNLSHIILISVVLDFSGLVLAEAVLSYVGVGVDPNMYSWGNMINGARMEMAREPVVWWSLGGAFVFMFILVFAANIFSDGVRDALDPRI